MNWIKENNRKLLALRKKKTPLKIIAKELGVTVSVVSYHLKKLNAPRRKMFIWSPEADAKVLSIYPTVGRPKRGTAKALAWEINKLPASVVYQRARFLRKRAANSTSLVNSFSINEVTQK